MKEQIPKFLESTLRSTTMLLGISHPKILWLERQNTNRKGTKFIILGGFIPRSNCGQGWCYKVLLDENTSFYISVYGKSKRKGKKR